MHYLVHMKLASYGTSMAPEDGLAFIERYVLPSLQMCAELQASGRIVAGGPVSGSIELAFVADAASVRELDDLIENLPIWPRMHTTVSPLTTFEGRAAAVQPRAERLKARIAAARAAAPQAGS